MAGGIQGGDDDELITAINVTPLVDVVLVLLIILMVTATAIVSKTIPMELPKAESGESAGGETLAVSIDEGGALFLDREPIDKDALREKVESMREDDPELKAVIAADGRIEHARVIEVIDLLRNAQVNRFAINVRPAEAAE